MRRWTSIVIPILNQIMRVDRITLGLHDMINLILYCLASIFKTIIDRIFIYSFRYNIKILVTRM